MSVEITESEQDFHVPIYDKVEESETQLKIKSKVSRLNRVLTLLKEMQPHSENDSSDEKDYTPFISAPSSSNKYATFYREHIEPQLISTLNDLDIDFFFTLNLLNVPTDSEVIISPLIIVYTSSEGVAIVKASLDQVWEANNFSEFLVSITHGLEMFQEDSMEYRTEE